MKTQAALPKKGAVLRVFFGLWVSGPMKLRRIRGYRHIGGTEKAAAEKKENSNDFSEKKRYSLSYRIRAKPGRGGVTVLSYKVTSWLI